MAKTQVLEYTIYLTDAAQVDSYNAQLDAGGGVDVGAVLRYYSPTTGAPVFGLLRAPGGTGAQVEFSAPLVLDAVAFTAPSIRSPWFTGGANFPVDVATFTRKSGGWFGISVLFGTTTKFYWAGRFAVAPALSGETPAPDSGEASVPAPPSTRRFVMGFENPDDGEQGGLGGNVASCCSPGASRVNGGLGFALRDDGLSRWSFTLPNIQIAVSGTRWESFSWERFYIRVRRMPTVATPIYKAENPTASGTGLQIYVTATGQLAFYQVLVGAGTPALVSILGDPLVLREWTKVDLLISTLGIDAATDTMQMTIRAFVNGVEIGSVTSGKFNGTVSAVRHSVSYLGRWVAEGDGEFDFDDWHNAEWPHTFANTESAPDYDAGTAYSAGDVVTSAGKAYECIAASTGNAPPDADFWMRLTDPLDWLYGTHVEPVRAIAYASDHSADWAGDFRETLGQPFHGGGASPPITGSVVSTTALAPLTIETDAPTSAHGANRFGAAALTIGLYSFRGTTSGTLGYDLNGAGAAMAAITQVASPNPDWNSQLVQLRPEPGVGHCLAIESLELRHLKGNDTTQSEVRSFRGSLQVVGLFGEEDRDAAEVSEGAPLLGLPPADPHHQFYPRAPWATAAPPFGAVAVVGGTYVGNNTGQDIVFPIPVHFVRVRRVTGTTDTGVWFVASGVASHGDLAGGILPHYLPQALFETLGAALEDDQEGQCRLRIGSGAAPLLNANGVTYQYIGFCDPAARFLRTGTVAHDDGGSFPQTYLLPDPRFTPLGGFFLPEEDSNATADKMHYKGPGHATTAGSFLAQSSAEIAQVASFAEGALAVYVPVVDSDSGIARGSFALWRQDDGNGETAVVQFATYVGNGSSPRVIPLTPASGRRPLFAVGVGTGSTARHYARDPSHTTTNSTALSSGTDNANGFTAGGIDEVTVGSNLNVSGVTYHLFVIPGGTTAGNGGWSENGEFWPVEPDSALDDAWIEPEELEAEDDEEDSPDPGGLMTDIAASCVVASTRLVNLALSRIGVTQEVTNLGTEESREAATARLHYVTEIDAVLRAHPWKFATRYATLTLVGGTAADPVNIDWQYSYRLPTDCVKVRRIIREGFKRTYDPAPPPFDVTEDATGQLLYTDEVTDADAELTVVIEYTARVACPAAVADPIFRSACAWRLAHAFAAPLARDAKQADRCFGMYLGELRQAEVAGQNEQQPQNPTGHGEAEWLRGRG